MASNCINTLCKCIDPLSDSRFFIPDYSLFYVQDTMSIQSKSITLWTRFFPDKEKYVGLVILPEDIILDEIMSRIDVRDILALRLVRRLASVAYASYLSY